MEVLNERGDATDGIRQERPLIYTKTEYGQGGIDKKRDKKRHGMYKEDEMDMSDEGAETVS